ncbi:MAG: translocation/assembly module TamB domain-containing protein [Ignavibacteria bacterium]|nr:translocation/assembly module TamB domain-containing protein [Ignavibacteria bacterium]
MLLYIITLYEKNLQKILKIFLWVAGILLFLLIGLFFFVQTNTFNNIALDYAVENLNEGLQRNDAEIHVTSLKGNIFTGLQLDSGNITLGNDTLIKFNYIDLKYDIWGLPDKKILLDHIIINSPEVSFSKIKDSTENMLWNFSKLFSSSDDLDTSASAFDWDISVNKLKIENGFFHTTDKYSDSLLFIKAQNNNQTEFDFNNLTVTDLNLELNAEYFTDNKSVEMKSFSFNTDADFNVKSFVFKAEIDEDDTITEVTSFEILTDLSHIKFNKLLLNNFNPFDTATFDDFKDKEFEADINIENINFSDLRFFVPDADMLDSAVSLVLLAKGKYGDFNISDLTLKLPESYINIKGNVRHLHEPDSLYLNIAAEDLDVLTKDINTVYNDNSIPDLSYLGRVKADLQFDGTFEKFYSEFDIASDAGSADGIVNMDLTNENYNGKISAANLDLGKILRDNSLSSRLNLYSEFSGRGFAPGAMATSVKYHLSNSYIAGYDIRISEGILNLSGNNVNLNIRHISSFGSVTAKGKVNIANMNNPAYALTGRVKNLNIAKFTKDSEDKSSLNFSYNVKGRGINPENINGSYNFDIEDSYFADNRIPQTALDIEVRTSGADDAVIVSTDFFDFNAEGSFDISSLGNVLSYNIGLISEKFQNKLMPDTAYIADYTGSYITYDKDNVSSQFNPDLNSNFNLNYELVLKDTVMTSRLLQPFGISYNGDINGNISNDQIGFSFDAVINAKDFVYQDTAVILENFNSNISLSNNYSQLTADNSISSIEMDLKTTGDKISFGSTIFDSVKIDINLENSLADFYLEAQQDSGLYATARGNADLTSDNITATFDSALIIQNNIRITNENDWIVNYIPGQKVNFEQFAVKSLETVLNVNGDFVFNGMSDLKIEGKELEISDIYSIINSQDTGKVIRVKESPVTGNISNLLISFKGDLVDPELNLKINSDILKYKDPEEELNIGDFKADINYKDHIATTDIVFNNAEGKGNLKITGDIPYRNPLTESDTLTESNISGKPVNLKLASENFVLDYFLKLIPSVPEIGGTMNGEITATGNASSPDLKGAITINDGKYYLSLTGMNYKFKLNTSTENSNLVIDNLSMSSINDEARNFNIFGNIDFSGMKINDIDLNSSGDMVFLDEDVEQNELGVYGYFRAGSGSPAIKIKGDLDKLSVTGQLLITDATISSVPLGGSGYDNKLDNFTYVTVSDSAINYAKDTLVITEANDYYKINPFARYKYTFDEKETSAADFLDLDINVKTQRNIYVSIDFDNLTKDRLFGEITADLNLKTEDKEFRAIGEVNIVNNSYYRFYKDFKLNNSKITFNGPIANPVLDIQAVHESIKNTQQYGITASIPVEVMLTIKGELEEPKIELKLIEDGTTVSGTDAQGDAITFLLFGKYKNELSTTERTAVASSLGTSIGSLYISSIVSQTVRDILPFIIDAQFNYSEGNVADTDVEFTSELGEATIKVGGKLLKEIRNFEFVIDYPLNNFLGLDLPETLMLEFYREEESNTIFGSSETTTNTGLKVLYRIKY